MPVSKKNRESSTIPAPQQNKVSSVSNSSAEEKKVPFWEKDVPFLSGSGGGKTKFKSKELIQFYRGVGSMLRAQMNTSDALNYYSKGLPNKKFADKLRGIRDDISRGMSAKEGFSRANCFNDMTIGLVQSGSDAGRLDEAFKALANRLETDMVFKKKIKKVVLIPSIVIPILILTFIVSQLKVVPQVEEMILGAGAEPDALSQVAFNFSHLVQDYWVYFLIILTITVLTIVFSDAVKNLILNMLMAKWRLLRQLIMSLRQMTLLSTMGLLHSNGISLAKSIRVSAQTVKGSNLHNEIIEAADRYEKTGIPVSVAFERFTSIDEQVCHMLAVGERSAAIDENLEMLANMYEEEAENHMETLTNLINALVMFVAVGLIAAVFISAFLPVFLMGPRLMQQF